MVKQDLHIRRATIQDAQLVSELSAITFSETFKGTCTDIDLKQFIDQYFNEIQISSELKDDHDFYFIGFINEEAVGYIRMKEDISDLEFINEYKAIELKRIYILKQYHSQKAGAALMNFAINFSKENGYKILWLGVWEHNEKAKTFYKKFGFIDSCVTHNFPIGQTPQMDHWLYKFI